MTDWMTSHGPKFEIPQEFASQLRYREGSVDQKNDEELLRGLTEHVPVTSEKNIWAFWDKGIQCLPAWCRRNICDWMRICSGTGWTVRVLDAIPGSPNHFLKFLPKDMLPSAIVEDEMTGPYTGAHSSDLLSGGLLYLFGGTYMDVGCMLLRSLDDIAWDELEDSSSAYRIAVPLAYGQTAANHFVMSRKGDPFIKRWHELWIHLWKGRKDHHGLFDNPLLSNIPALSTYDPVKSAKFSTLGVTMEPREFMEYIGQVLAWQRLTLLEDPGDADGFNGAEYWQKHVFAFDSHDECFGLESCVGFKGETGLKVLTTSMADTTTDEYQTAYRAIWRTLTGSSMQKVSHYKGMTQDPCLGTLLDMPEHEGKDAAAGTFAELLRFGAVHFQQTRKIEQVETNPPPQIFKKGLYEVF